MKDSRITIWTNTTSHATGTTTNTGPTLDLRQGYTINGGTGYPTDPEFGIGVQILQTNVTGTGQVTTWTWEYSADDSTFYTGGTIGVATLDVASEVVRFKATIHTQSRYVRLKASNVGTGTSTSVAYAEDCGNGYSQAFAVA